MPENSYLGSIEPIMDSALLCRHSLSRTHTVILSVIIMINVCICIKTNILFIYWQIRQKCTDVIASTGPSTFNGIFMQTNVVNANFSTSVSNGVQSL